jgi:hypothetical protein
MYPKPRKPEKRQSEVRDEKTPLLELIILGFTIYWLLSFFGVSMIPGMQHSSGFIDTLSVAIVVLIIIRFLT